MNEFLAEVNSPPPATGSLAPAPPPTAKTHAAPTLHDRLAVGMAFLVVLTIVQRGVGLLRNIWFCRLLEPEELGRWNLAFSFLMLAAPLAVAGLPGSFGRYAEHYRKRGHLRTFLRRTALASAALGLTFVVILILAPGRWAQWIFRDGTQGNLMLMTAVTLAGVIAFNFLTELFTALRRSRIASTLQFTHSLIFTVLGLGLLVTTAGGAGAVAGAYGAACIIACLGASLALRESWRAAPESPSTLSHLDFWSKLLPFAAWIWVANLLANLTDVADRYMILYFAPGDAVSASALIGHYHSSRVAPDVLAGIVAMLASVLLPYNSHDWEAGNHAAVVRRINLAIKLAGIVLTAAGVAVLMLSSVLFQGVLEGKYDLGEAVLPWTLVQASWLSLSVLAMGYLWCAERAQFAVAVTAVGLTCNVILNLWLVPWLALEGAVIATAVANAAAFITAIGLSHRLGMRISRGGIATSLLPLTLLLGPAAAFVAVMAFAAISVGTTWVFTADEKMHVLSAAHTYWERVFER